MKYLSIFAAILAIFILTISTPVFAESPCITCLNKAKLETEQCLNKIPPLKKDAPKADEADRNKKISECNKSGADKIAACNNGVCKK